MSLLHGGFLQEVLALSRSWGSAPVSWGVSLPHLVTLSTDKSTQARGSRETKIKAMTQHQGRSWQCLSCEASQTTILQPVQE